MSKHNKTKHYNTTHFLKKKIPNKSCKIPIILNKQQKLHMPRSKAFKSCFSFKPMFNLRASESPEDVKKLFDEYSENGMMSVHQLHKFLVEQQGERDATEEDAQAIFNGLKHLQIFQRKGLHLDAFFRYLLGDLNSPLPPPKVQQQDMEAPLSHYFLYTGHNSYLTGNQLSSNSSFEPIIKALRRGVRVIELDLWSNSKKDGIDVCHGGTLTSRVELSKCLFAIREYAFVASDYPVIITFEDHLDSKFQAKVAEMVTKIFGDMLYCPMKELTKFPSPNSLKHKILISTRPPKETKTEYNKDSSSNQDDDDDDDDEVKEIPEYKHLISIHARKRKGGFRKTLASECDYVRRVTFSEPKLLNDIKDYGTDIVKFTQRNLLRVYPKGTRIASSNYNPLHGWTHGAQMVAINMQGYDKYLWITQGMFRANGGCGYVKKPSFMLKDGPNGEVFDPKICRPVKTTLKVKLYMGDGWHLDFSRTHFKQFSPPSFFTKVEIHGVPADKAKAKTKPIEDQWTPVWNREFEFPLTVPELAFLRIQVQESDTSRRHTFGGQTCLPVWELKTGIRAVPLHDKRGDRYRSVKLLMRFEFN